MVRIYTFVGLCAGTYVGVKALDNLVVWMADRREANIDNVKLEREASHLRQQLLQEMKEKQATTIPNRCSGHSFAFAGLAIDDQVLSLAFVSNVVGVRDMLFLYILSICRDPDKVQEKHDKHLKQLDEHKGLKKHQEDKHHRVPDKYLKQRDEPKLLTKSPDDEHQNLPDKPLKKEDDRKLVRSQPENCPGEVVAECLNCGETFEIVEPVPHSPKEEGR